MKNINTERDVEVYGDLGWLKVCPQYYRGYLDQQSIEAKFQEDNCVILLANYGFTYLDHSAPVYDVIRHGSHWINVPPLVKTKELSGLSNIEYKNINEFNHLLENIKLPYNKAKESIDVLHKIYYNSTSSIVDILKNNERGNYSNSKVFENSYKEHRRLLDKKIDIYIESNEVFLMECIGISSAIELI